MYRPISFVWKYENVEYCYSYARSAENFWKTATAMTGIFNNFVTPLSSLDYFCDPPIFHEKILCPAFSWPPYSIENDSPLKGILWTVSFIEVDFEKSKMLDIYKYFFKSKSI